MFDTRPRKLLRVLESNVLSWPTFLSLLAGPIPAALGALTQLEALGLKNNRLTGETAAAGILPPGLL